jgi:hypothetical protein
VVAVPSSCPNVDPTSVDHIVQALVIADSGDAGSHAPGGFRRRNAVENLAAIGLEGKYRR